LKRGGDAVLGYPDVKGRRPNRGEALGDTRALSQGKGERENNQVKRVGEGLEEGYEVKEAIIRNE